MAVPSERPVRHWRMNIKPPSLDRGAANTRMRPPAPPLGGCAFPSKAMTRDYKATVFLPKTDFPMRAGLPQREPEILARWEEIDLFARLREAARGRPKWVLHDGPPYANGHLHMGHALNRS